MGPALATAFGTASSSATLPVTINNLEVPVQVQVNGKSSGTGRGASILKDNKKVLSFKNTCFTLLIRYILLN